MDIDSIGPGADFEELLAREVGVSAAVVVVIGPEWVTAVDDRGRRRLEDPRDLVRVEVASALAGGTLVVPVLIGSTPMPRPEELPEDLLDLTRRNGVTVTDTRWNADLEPLLRALEASLELEPAEDTKSQAVARARDIARRLRASAEAASEVELEETSAATAEQLSAVDPDLRDRVGRLAQARRIPADALEKHLWALPAFLEEQEELCDVLSVGVVGGMTDELAAVTNRRILLLAERPWQPMTCAALRLEPREQVVMATAASVSWWEHTGALAVTTRRVVFIRSLIRGRPRASTLARSEVRRARRQFRHSDIAVTLSGYRRDITFGGLSGSEAAGILLALTQEELVPADARLNADSVLAGLAPARLEKDSVFNEGTLWRYETVLGAVPEEADNIVASTLCELGARPGKYGVGWRIRQRWPPAHAALNVYIEPLAPAHSLVVLRSLQPKAVPDFGLREHVFTQVRRRLDAEDPQGR